MYNNWVALQQIFYKNVHKQKYFLVKSHFRHPLGGLAAPQTPLLSRGASPPGPPDLKFSKHNPQMTPK